jgi:hypothetical protein
LKEGRQEGVEERILNQGRVSKEGRKEGRQAGR